MNILPMRLVIDDDETFLTLIRKVQGEFVRMLRHSEYPVGNTALDEAYDLVFNYVNMPALYEFNGVPVVHEFVRSQEGEGESLLQTSCGRRKRSDRRDRRSLRRVRRIPSGSDLQSFR